MIPNILHRVAIGTPPESAERWWAKFKVLHPTWTLMTHTDDPNNFPRTAPHWANCKKVAQQADLMRYEVLQQYGGVYVDWDVEPYKALDPFLGLQGFVACEAHDRAGNAVLGFEKDHPALEEILRVALKVADSNSPDIFAGGPVAVSKVCFGRGDVLTLPAGSFYQMDFSDRHRTTRDGMFNFPWVYGVHRINASWLSTERIQHLTAVTVANPALAQGYASNICAVIPTRYDPPQLEPLLEVLRGDGVHVILQRSEDFGHELHRMWNDGVRQAKEWGCSTVAILNDDIVMLPGTLALMEKALRSDPLIGAVHPEIPRTPTKPRLPSALRVNKNSPFGMAGFAFLYDPNDEDAPSFPEEYHLWMGDIKFFEGWRAKRREVVAVTGLIIAHEQNHSVKKALGSAYHAQNGVPMRDRLEKAVEAGDTTLQPYLDDLLRSGTGVGRLARPAPGRRVSWEREKLRRGR